MPRRVSFFVQPCSCEGTCGGCEPVAAAAGEIADDDLPGRWHGVVVLEGLRTGDNRAIRPNALEFRDLPLPLWAMARNAGHFDAPLVGQIDSLERAEWDAVPGVNLIRGSGTFDLGGEEGREAARLVATQVLRWGSADLDVFASEIIGTPPWEEEAGLLLAGADVDDWWEEVTSGRIAGFTLHSHPAFQQCVVCPEGTDLAIPLPVEAENATLPGMIAAGVHPEPPVAYFADPSLDGPTPLTVTDEGRVYGHIATWGTCHTGLLKNGCTRPPRSTLNYEPFHSGGFVQTSDGGTVRVGHLTMDGPHADLHLTSRQTRRHYDDSTTVWAHVRAGEDEHGIWVAGAVAPGITEEQMRRARALAVSGDWRAWPGAGLELIAALSVPVPGFPVGVAASASAVEPIRPRARLVEEQPVSLVAAGMLAPSRPTGLTAAAVEAIVERATADLRAAVSLLDPLIVARLTSEMDALAP